VREHGFYKSNDKQPPAGRKSALKKGQSKPGVKFSKVNRVQSEDGGEEDDDSCIDSEVSSDSSMSVDRPPKSLVWKDRPKSKKVSKIRTVSTIHRTTRLEPSTEDTTNDTAPQPNVGDAADTVSEEPAPSEPPSEPTSEPPIQVQDVQPPVPAQKKARMVWPPRAGAPGFGMHRGRMYYSETEEQDEHDDPPLPATTSSTRRSFPVPKYEDCHTSQSLTLSSQETLRMTSPLEAIESNTASARRNSIERNATSKRKPFYPNYQAGLLGIPDALALAQTRVAAGALTLAKTQVAAGPTPSNRGLRR
jgi:hypothetical protein